MNLSEDTNDLLAISFFLSLLHHLYFFSGLKFSAFSALSIYLYGFPEMPCDSQLASHIYEKRSMSGYVVFMGSLTTHRWGGGILNY